jgi:hypothetical protein
MAWTARSSFFDYLMADEDAWYRLMAGHAGFDRFARVLLDEERARRVDLTDVARMDGVELPALLALANGERQDSRLPEGHCELPAIDDDCCAGIPGSVELDLRPVFDRGQEPLDLILDAADAVPAGATGLADGAWQVVFRRGPEIEGPPH